MARELAATDGRRPVARRGVAALGQARRGADPSTLRALLRERPAAAALDTEMRIAAACGRRLAGRRGAPLAALRRELSAEIAALRQELEGRCELLEAHEGAPRHAGAGLMRGSARA